MSAKNKIVITLGGNALGNTPQEQKEIVKITAKAVVDVIESGAEVVIAHGNGPQVGMINNAFDAAHKVDSKIPDVPLVECGAMSQAYIGYHLQSAIKNELLSRNIEKDVVTLITQSEVSANDPAFQNPTKPVGFFYSEAEAKALAAANKWVVKEDAGRGWRRVVASPKPINIVEANTINNLIEKKCIVICTGGGGIPVIKGANGYEGVAAVIDKDFGSAKLAEITNASKLLILTAVPKVTINYKKPDQKEIDTLTIDQANKYIAQNQFAPGSMLPKVQAAMQFVMSGKNKVSIIAELKDAAAALAGKAGTTFSK